MNKLVEIFCDVDDFCRLFILTCSPFCVLTLENSFTVTGESACASPENFAAEIGRKIAHQNAVNKIRSLEGCMYISASNKARPLVVDRDRTPLTAQDGRPYSGCYVNATINIFAYDNNGKGISASLGSVQFLRDSDAFTGGGVASIDEFEDLSEGAEAESFI